MDKSRRRYWKMRAKKRSHTFDSRIGMLPGTKGMVTGMYLSEDWKELKKLEKELIADGMLPDRRRGRRRTKERNEDNSNSPEVQG